ncbi:MAG: MBL fold metallo-hydrolase [Thermodesulfobacteriota bacterium]|nr:MBL fold metallo-hydrolase [Thermodesulfobacteriota bacterium]
MKRSIYHINGGYANTYLLETNAGLVAVDVGSPLAATMVVDFIRGQLGKKIDTLRLVTATHFHIDHIGGISHLLKLTPEVKINLYVKAGNYLSGKEKLSIPSLSSWIFGLGSTMTQFDNHFRNIFQFFKSQKVGIPLPLLRLLKSPDYRISAELEEGKEIPQLPGWKLLPTSGHTPDSICLYQAEDKTLITGDTILNMRGTGELNTFCCDYGEIKDSFAQLSCLDVEHIYPGHGRPIVGVTDALSRVKVLP